MFLILFEEILVLFSIDENVSPAEYFFVCTFVFVLFGLLWHFWIVCFLQLCWIFHFHSFLNVRCCWRFQFQKGAEDCHGMNGCIYNVCRIYIYCFNLVNTFEFYDTTYLIHHSVILSFHNQLLVHRRQVCILDQQIQGLFPHNHSDKG